jgi:Spy/CpxP family protein refolding chaperone
MKTHLALLLASSLGLAALPFPSAADTQPATTTAKKSSRSASSIPPYHEQRWGPGMMGSYGHAPGMMGGGYGRGGYGPMMGGGGGCGHGMTGLNALNLSDDQWTKIDQLTDELRQKHWPLMKAMMDESAKLRALYRAEKPDSAAIGKIYQKIFDLKRQMIETGIDQKNRIQEVLTPEQRQQLRRWQPAGLYDDGE